jgi:hypothetical protein
MGVIIEICVKHPGGPTRMRVADIRDIVSSKVLYKYADWKPASAGRVYVSVLRGYHKGIAVL